MATNNLPGISSPARTDLPVLKPYVLSGGTYDEMFLVRWLAGIPPQLILLMLLAWPTLALAQTPSYGMGDAFAALWRWIPFLTFQGFVFNVVISVFSMLIGTFAGAALGLGQISQNNWLRRLSWGVTQLFRNAPWLVILFIVLLAFPFEIEIFGLVIPIPAWMKAVIGLSLPIMANISEIVRGAVMSVPSAQWEAAEALSFSRTQTLWQIILPQCFKRMIPPWMNWYAILTMATPLCSLLGVGEIITFSRQAMEAENNRPELLVPFFGYALVLFFAYCYPIARITIALEKRFAVKL
ncbi:amino acid ABC transporter permease [Phaeobacter gallaeciensis]|uniref:Amino acid ABC transporter membrane protein 2, PAAT family n=1 Tax=Phaeobacter gallaeciensis TaxID=60890 RepID=A0AAC9Z6M9_9RHOB|nr:amino acid ABC transporter permease [Phaeobacter gallaeciensis]AHD08923.1 amino acid ABC transporter membrane protein 2, PAAT family [Phaeobacter gallaeciensis DSM 26640]ATE92189.1 amino acid ABC transporter membrane protein 2, PAAT family [Phaeobacter gallaeciensis]ATE97992.1 amino acid ABC transporter membrane protein 2, PAAT family [Phaeobacter gallaeciensis]ATF00851.1 amino acid ABC transporter membrane protein 2, PAAT family [Phaeobacter gallaeciensis]ATF05231.1 amino acid ABC transpor